MEKSAMSGNGRGEFIIGLRLGDFAYAYYRDPNGEPRNQTKVFRADASEVHMAGDTTHHEDAFRGARLERVWVKDKDLPEQVKETFCKCSGVKTIYDLIWAPGQEPARPQPA